MSRSTFPQKIDVFRELFDLPANQVANALELQRLKQKTTLTNDEQNQISALSAQLQDYMITPETMNKLQDAIVEIETFFDGNVRKYILEKQKGNIHQIMIPIIIGLHLVRVTKVI